MSHFRAKRLRFFTPAPRRTSATVVSTARWAEFPGRTRPEKRAAFRAARLVAVEQRRRDSAGIGDES